MNRIGALLACVVAFASAPSEPLRAQGLQFTFGGTGAQEIVQSHVDVTSTRFTGLMLGLEGVMTSDRFVVRVRYSEGHVKAKESGTARDVVAGEALFGFRAMPWLTLWVGPAARAYTTDDDDQRWMIWTGRASGRGTLIPGRMQTYVELWGALSGSVGNPGIKAGGRGADAGLEMRIGGQSFWGRLGYRIESAHAEGLRETVEAVTLTVIYGLPQ